MGGQMKVPSGMTEQQLLDHRKQHLELHENKCVLVAYYSDSLLHLILANQYDAELQRRGIK